MSTFGVSSYIFNIKEHKYTWEAELCKVIICFQRISGMFLKQNLQNEQSLF